ncbi:hypothetical protein MSM1_13475 [Mycobacterium sp. SM1]|uniref:hypothetical protein n=1 Tax=Mycobacterium sp. SM1 TaxID=2816243 RepID=UPI001BD123AB|nr:hypothetical protein [Mycobacterium sp. SM1]MBS4729302.1 hypothetical protein [Mycobacterium sp. SM1]
MKAPEKRLLVAVVCGAVATCVTAAVVTHNGTSGPLTLAQVLITAIIPLVLLAAAAMCYTPKTPKRVPQTSRPRKNAKR